MRNSTKLQTKLRAELKVWVRVRFKFKQQKKGKKELKHANMHTKKVRFSVIYSNIEEATRMLNPLEINQDFNTKTIFFPRAYSFSLWLSEM